MARGRKPDRPALVERSTADTKGMSPDSYNAAVSMQCAIRDAIDRPVTMHGAIEAINEYVREHGLPKGVASFIRDRFDRMQAEAARAHEEAERISRENAGR